MKRAAFKMQLKEGFYDGEEYRKRHDAIWPEMKKLLREAGIGEYSIFLDTGTGTLFAVQEVAGESGSQNLGKTEIVKKWWAYMADIMETHGDNSPVSIELEEVFYLA